MLNIDEDAPEIFYIFIGRGTRIYNQVNLNNYKLNGCIISGGFAGIIENRYNTRDFILGNIQYAPFIPNKNCNSNPTSHTMAVTNSYNTEYILEYHRNKQYPSRFSCVYAFGDYESCEKAIKIYKWDLNNVRKFKLKKTNSELDSCIKIAKCNMEIVTRMWNCDIAIFERESIEKMAEAYWAGIGQITTETTDIDSKTRIQRTCDVLYEYLIEGILEEVK